MTWEAAMRWALIRARDTGVRHRVVAYRRPFGSVLGGRWGYMIRRAE